MKIEIFKRKAWTPNPAWPDGFEPFATKGKHVKFVETEAEAREICLSHNATRPQTGKGKYNFVFLEWRFTE